LYIHKGQTMKIGAWYNVFTWYSGKAITY
jgi:hypothetical protein